MGAIQMIKWFKSLFKTEPLSTEKPRIRFDYKGRLVEASWPKDWSKDKVSSFMQYLACLEIQYNGNSHLDKGLL